MTDLSASKLELAIKCVGAFTLPWRNQRNQWSDAGNEDHARDESAINRGDVPAILTERWPGFTWRAEVAYAYDVSSGEGRELGVSIGRNYKLRPFEIPGTADVEGRYGSALVIVDKKSYEETTKAADNPQVRFLALAAARTHGLDAADVAINHKLRGLDVATMDVFDLDVTAHAVRQIMLDVARVRDEARGGVVPTFSTGRHCRWCNAFDSCPKQSELLSLVKQEDVALQSATSVMPVLDDTNAPDVYDLYKRIGMLHKRIGQSLYAHAADRPIQLSNGKLFGKNRKQGNREYDGDMVHAVVTEKYGRDVADSVVERSATQSRLEEKLRDVVPSGALASAKKSVLAEVEKRGGMKREWKESIEEFTPQLKAVNE